MPFNRSGTLAAFQAIFRPRIIAPNLIVQDIRELNFAAFRRAGFKGVVIDKDNCLTLPHKDALIPELEVAWKEVKNEFGPNNVLIVSNSAGTRDDAGGIAAESVSRLLGTPVLRHSSLKPSRGTVADISRYFSSLPQPVTDARRLLMIGDRVFTDIVLARKMGAYGILVTRNWTRTLSSILVGRLEHMAVRASQRRGFYPLPVDISEFTRPMQKGEVKLGYSGSTWTWTGRALGWGIKSNSEKGG